MLAHRDWHFLFIGQNVYIFPPSIIKPNTQAYPAPAKNESVIDYAVRIYHQTGRHPHKRKIFAGYYPIVKAINDLYLLDDWLTNYPKEGGFWRCQGDWWVFDEEVDAAVFKMKFS
jgi:hypothetical protein